ncbi:MAG TPA: pyridoxal phosphate-dependent aminotransferase, partial [Amycolatopsis sp.]|nr:pyridoxal phosphate-dependent aminotransferase [Amycolatopsis sp.]
MSEHEPVVLGQPTVGDEELAAVAEVFRSGWLAGAGPACRRFEERFAKT